MGGAPCLLSAGGVVTEMSPSASSRTSTSDGWPHGPGPVLPLVPNCRRDYMLDSSQQGWGQFFGRNVRRGAIRAIRRDYMPGT
ncbi:UNVERIFIED_CONTAM: hypothetical protein Sangu_1719300 [Sesamum angustifolium]|uniref:Uncharacterized protein n=1 Tax=Sesamum angustifolium TaxID=2727405 RepID=A0AAW2MLS0_9LAMI